MEVVIDIETEGVAVNNRPVHDIASELLDGQSSSVHFSLSDTSATKEFDTIKSFKCFSCRAARAKYRCPGCATPTCSLACVRKHKVLLECDGQRNRVRFRRLEQFSNLDILSDYRLLEEISRDNESKKRKPRPRKCESRKIRLKDNVRVLCDIVLHLLPPKFVRAKENDSSWDAKKKTAKWRIGWDFDGTVIQTAPLKDSVILKTALFQATSHMPKADRLVWKKLIGSLSIKLTLKQEKGMSSEMMKSLRLRGGDEDQRSGLEMITAKEVEKSARWPANLKTTIASNLRGSTFIEFPTFKVEKLTPNAGKEEAGVVMIEEVDRENEDPGGHVDEADEAEDNVEESETESSSSEEEEMEDEEGVGEEVAPLDDDAEEEEGAIYTESDEDESDLNTSAGTDTLSRSLSSEVGGEEEI